MHCTVYQRAVQKLRHQNLSETFIRFDTIYILTSVVKVCFSCGRFRYK
jgi:hypothetical protein